MKKLIYIFSVLILVSCANETSKSMSEDAVEFEAKSVEEFYVGEDFKILKSFKYEDLSTEKLQEFYDLIALNHKYPEFNEAVISQLKSYTNDTITTLIKKEGIIKNVSLKGKIIKLSDSIQKMKLNFDVVSNNLIKKDSIWVIITTNAITIEGEKIKSNKVTFSFN